MNPADMLRLVTSLLVSMLAVFPAAQTVNDKPELENAWVRVWRSTRAPHEKTPVAEHPPSVIVYLTDARERVTGADGRTHDLTRDAGSVAYLDEAKYGEENASDRPLEAIVIELKPGAPPSPPVALDPVKLDPSYHTVPLENDRVRVLRTVLEPGVRSPLHEHPHYVVVYLTELHTTMELADGRVVDNPRRPGEIAWREAMKHATENVGPRTAVEIQVEVK
jgi:quercetin dioxygenase-like cupin family protein